MNDERQLGNRGGDRSLDLPPELQAFEAEVALLRPRSDPLNRERLAFLAGQASTHLVERKGLLRWGWPASFSVMTAVAASLLCVLLTRPESRVVERIVYVPTAQPTDAVLAAAPVSTGNSERQGVAAPRTSDFHLRQDDLVASRLKEVAGYRSSPIDPRLRLFEHLLAEKALPPGPANPPADGNTDAVNHSIWSVGSLHDLLGETVSARPAAGASYRRTHDNSGANS